ncbi:MAG: amidophosphoribosyltransferase [Saccharofermentanales bacterium]
MCGIFGIMGGSEVHAARMTYYGLFSLQHRGQESCGIAVNNDGDVTYHKDMGLVGEVFSDTMLDRMPGKMAVGHVRYSTTGSSVRENAQPLVIKYVKGSLSIVHNGNLTNTDFLRKQLESGGAIFQTTIDSEIIAYLIAKERTLSATVEEAICKVIPKLEGSYSLLVMSPKKIIAVRDPLGYRPLCYGVMDDGSVVFASESCALDPVGARFIRDVDPGEIVIADRHGIRSIRTNCGMISRKCIFEYIYFARPDSFIDGISVYRTRLEAGKLLYDLHPADADLVIGVPDSGIDAALGYSQASGIPYCKGFVKNNYVGRTFIQPTQNRREISVGIKLNVLAASVKGKRIVLIDDSIVRGTTMARIVRMIKEAGALEVHVRISSPTFRWPCYYGTDIPSADQLTASTNSVDQICTNIGADSLGFLELDSLSRMISCEGEKCYCDACFSGDHPGNIKQDI